MRIVIAPDSFKESLTALEVAQAIKIGFQKILPHAEYVLVPMADGGEGTVQSLVDATQGEIINTEVIAPWGIQSKHFLDYLETNRPPLSKWRQHRACI